MVDIPDDGIVDEGDMAFVPLATNQASLVSEAVASVGRDAFTRELDQVDRRVQVQRVCVIVATFGDAHWQRMGDDTMSRTMQAHASPMVTFLRWHGHTLAGSRNTAALNVDRSADWLCFLDADDELAPGYFQSMDLAILEHDMEAPREQALYVPAVQFWTMHKPEDNIEVPWDGQPVCLDDVQGHRDLMDLNHAVIGTLIRRDFFLEAGGFNPEVPVYEDWELWLRCERLGAKFVQVRDAVYRAQVRDFSRNRMAPGVAKAWYDRIRLTEQEIRMGIREPLPLGPQQRVTGV